MIGGRLEGRTLCLSAMRKRTSMVVWSVMCRRPAGRGEAMKGEDPAIRIFLNDNNPNANRVGGFLTNDGGTADGLETHGKWLYGGKPKLLPGTFKEWREEVPLRDRKNGNRSEGGRVWREVADDYRTIAKAAGRTLLIANNEYGLGSGRQRGGLRPLHDGLAAF